MLERNKMGDEKMKTATEMIKILKKEIVVLERKELLENFGYYKSKNYNVYIYVYDMIVENKTKYYETLSIDTIYKNIHLHRLYFNNLDAYKRTTRHAFLKEYNKCNDKFSKIIYDTKVKG